MYTIFYDLFCVYPVTMFIIQLVFELTNKQQVWEQTSLYLPMF